MGYQKDRAEVKPLPDQKDEDTPNQRVDTFNYSQFGLAKRLGLMNLPLQG